MSRGGQITLLIFSVLAGLGSLVAGTEEHSSAIVASILAAGAFVGWTVLEVGRQRDASASQKEKRP